MANELIKLKTGSLSKMNDANGGLSQVAIDKGTVYFATDSTTKAGKIWFDTTDGKRIDMTAFSQESINAITADNVSGTVAIENGGTGATTATAAKENLGLGNAKIFYGTCNTAAATVAKAVVCDEFKATDLVKGAIIFVTFDNTNSGAVDDITLNVSGTGAKPIKKIYNGAITDLSKVEDIFANQTYSFTYDGTNWVCGNTDYNTNSTWSVMSANELKAGTATSNRIMRASYIKSAFTASDGIFQPGSADGTISIYGQDLAITGLKSAAFTEASTYATKTEVNGLLAAADAMVFKGTIAGTSTSPGAYTPAANCGDTYKVSTAGYINGQKVEAGDMFICTADSTVAATSSNYSTVQNTWTIVQTNTDGVVIGPASATNGNIALFDGTTGKLIKDSGYALSSFAPAGNYMVKDVDYVTAGKASSIVMGNKATAEGYGTRPMGNYSHTEGAGTGASGEGAHAEGTSTMASGNYSHAEGTNTTASKVGAHAEGSGSQANGYSSHAEGGEAQANGDCSHAEGGSTTAGGYAAHVEGSGATASGSYSHAEGGGTTASNIGSHAEGEGTKATGQGSHAEGGGTEASGRSSHAEGASTKASGANSHAEGTTTEASGDYSHAEGNNNIANHRSQHVFGEYNIADSSTAAVSNRGNYVEIVGNGTSSTRSNARTLDWNGNETLAGKLTVGGDPTAALEVATKRYVDNSFAANDAMIFKGTIGTGGTVTTLPDVHNIGWTYRVITAGTYAGATCEIGDLIICVTDGTTADNTHWTVAQTNIDGAVIGPSSATGNNFASFNGSTGKLIADSGYSASSFATAGHVHGNLTNDGKIGSDANKAIYTGTSGILQAGTLPVAAGGTGLTTSTYKNAVLIGNASTATNAFRTIRTGNGAFYATAQDGAPQFGTLPLAQGGTGATSFTANSIIMSGSTTTAALTTRAVTNKTSNAAITNNNTNIPTMNTIYYGLVTVNNASQTRATGIYAPTSAGTKNQVLVSAGGTNAPTWATPEWTTVQIVRW